jgi:hypothetical protein
MDRITETDTELATVTRQCEEGTAMSTDCAAGFHTGITSTASLSENGRLGLLAVNKYADDDSDAYQCCYSIGARYALTYEELVGVFKRALNVISGFIGKAVVP